MVFYCFILLLNTDNDDIKVLVKKTVTLILILVFKLNYNSVLKIAGAQQPARMVRTCE